MKNAAFKSTRFIYYPPPPPPLFPFAPPICICLAPNSNITTRTVTMQPLYGIRYIYIYINNTSISAITNFTIKPIVRILNNHFHTSVLIPSYCIPQQPIVPLCQLHWSKTPNYYCYTTISPCYHDPWIPSYHHTLPMNILILLLYFLPPPIPPPQSINK